MFSSLYHIFNERKVLSFHLLKAGYFSVHPPLCSTKLLWMRWPIILEHFIYRMSRNSLNMLCWSFLGSRQTYIIYSMNMGIKWIISGLSLCMYFTVKFHSSKSIYTTIIKFRSCVKDENTMVRKNVKTFFHKLKNEI